MLIDRGFVNVTINFKMQKNGPFMMGTKNLKNSNDIISKYHIADFEHAQSIML